MAAAVHPPASNSFLNPTVDMTANMDFNHDFDVSLSFEQPTRSANLDGLPTPAPTHRNSHGPATPPATSSSSRLPLSSGKLSPPLLADPEDDVVQALPNPHRRETQSPIPAAGALQLAQGSPKYDPPVRRASKSSPPPPNPDAQRQLTESPTSYGVSNANEYSEGFRLFPPSPASSLPRPQTLDTQQREAEPEPMPEQDGRPSWDNKQWFRDQIPEQPEPRALTRRDHEQLPQLPPQHQVSHEPAVRTRVREDPRWEDSWRAREEGVWAEPAPPRARAEVRVSGSARVQAQQPTVVAAPPPVQQQQVQPQVEEVCIECAMRDQDMADVDVTSPGVWARDSDADYEDLLRRETAEEEAGIVSEDPKRPRARGGRLTEANLRLWLTLNPKEPTSKRANLDAYVRSQYALLEAETVARARAMQESRRLDDRMRDTYSALRRSTFDLHNGDGGVRLENSGHGRDVTLLENGLIVEHVDVKREERARRREEKRARGRKSSRGSIADVASIYSIGSRHMYSDGVSGGGLAARSSSSRPMSVLTAPIMGDSMSGSPSIIGVGANGIPQSRSTMSVESPNRRTRFFGMRNFSQGFRSSDSLAAQSGFSGSMVDMHVALQREKAPYGQPQRPSSLWHEYVATQPVETQGPAEPVDEKPKKKKKGLAKLWGIVTGHSKHATPAAASNTQTRSLGRDEDDLLAPPPPMSYLANRSSNREVGQRHVSTPSLPSSSMPNPGYGSTSTGVSPPSAPSSSLPSPTSARPFGAPDTVHIRRGSGGNTHESEQMINGAYALQPPIVLKPVGEEAQAPTPRGMPLAHMTSEPDMRQRLSLADAPPVPRIPATIGGRPVSWRDKSLPPLPGEMGVRGPAGENRPRTLFGMYDELEPPMASFRQEAGRRQSFSGLASNVMQPGVYAAAGMDMGMRQESSGMLMPPTTPTQTKRKSKFGFGALLGRTRNGSTSHDSHAAPSIMQQHSQQQQFRSSGSEARHEALVNVSMLQPASPHAHAFPRMSMSLTSRKNIETLVDQAPDFVAYRYPSGMTPATAR